MNSDLIYKGIWKNEMAHEAGRQDGNQDLVDGQGELVEELYTLEGEEGQQAGVVDHLDRWGLFRKRDESTVERQADQAR